MADIIFISFYRFLIFPLLILVLKLLSFFNPKIKKGFEIRRGSPWHNVPESLKGCVLVHCASGEFEYAKAVIRELKKANQKVCVTYFSPSYEKQVKGFDGINLSWPLPWDFAKTQKDFLEKLSPKKILIARTDLWPEFLYQAGKLNIPTILFSATLSEESSKLRGIGKLYFAWISTKLSQIFCVSFEDQKNFSLVTKTKVTALGDTRYDQVVHRLENPRPIKESLRPDQPTLVIGSSWPEDEAQLFPIFQDLLRNNIRIMIAPHEPTPSHLKSMAEEFQELGLHYQLYSESSEWELSKIMVIDQVGILADLYQWGTWAFVGGSFKNTVHSVMEPLAQGCVTFFGPLHTNNREAIEFNQAGLAYAIPNGDEMLKKILETVSKLPSLQDDIRNAIRRKTGASKKLVEEILRSQ
jgi:3-deoxy-D-manno-octulosonic-acid transferase